MTEMIAVDVPALTRVPVAPEVELETARFGSGEAILLVHGFPHTWRVWSEVIPALAADHLVLAPDLRGFGASTPTHRGLDADTLSRDLESLLVQQTAAGRPSTVVAIDAGVAPSFLLALRRPDLVKRLVLIEATLGRLPGAEAFFAAGAPWWFGFHAVPGLAERVLAGNEAAYVDFFLDAGTPGHAIAPELRAALRDGYARPGGLDGAMAYYRELPVSAEQIAVATADARLTVPTSAIGAAPVGPALANQLSNVADTLDSELIPDCGHIVSLHRPEILQHLILRHLA